MKTPASRTNKTRITAPGRTSKPNRPLVKTACSCPNRNRTSWFIFRARHYTRRARVWAAGRDRLTPTFFLVAAVKLAVVSVNSLRSHLFFWTAYTQITQIREDEEIGKNNWTG